jgi:hypothetical protein
MGPRFENPVLLPNGDLKVEGPFETYGEVIDDVVIRFLIMGNGHGLPPILGTATLAQDDLKRDTHPNGDVITRGVFSKTVPNSLGLRRGARVRGIGLAVAVKRSDDDDPPAFETFTWCVNLVVR